MQTKTKIKRTKGEKVVFAIMFTWLLIYSLTFLAAYFFILMNTFKHADFYDMNSIFAFPDVWDFNNYAEVLTTFNYKGSGYFQMCLHTIWFSLTGSIPSLISTAACSYAYARYKFPGRRIIFGINIVMLTLSLPGSQPAFYKLFCDLGMRNSWKYIFGCFDGFGSRFIILVGFWKGIDWAYAEAAYMDGGTEWTVFRKVMIPQAMPMLSVFFLLGFINAWGAYEFTMLYMDNYPSIALGLFLYQQGSDRVADTPMYYSALALTAIPSLILFSIFQDRILSTINIGGLKG